MKWAISLAIGVSPDSRPEARPDRVSKKIIFSKVNSVTTRQQMLNLTRFRTKSSGVHHVNGLKIRE